MADALPEGFSVKVLGEVNPRDGWAIELWSDSGDILAEVFEDDATKARTVTFFTSAPVPLEALKALLGRAHRWLEQR